MSAWDWFQQEAEALGVPVSDEQRALFVRYHELLVKANETTNLTRIVDERDAIIKHYLDALLFLRAVPAELQEKPLRFIDVGTGPGIPGLPLLIMRPHWSGVLLDSVGKKVTFMKETATALGLTGAEPTHARAEDLGQDPKYREKFDLSFARALAAMPELVELCLPFVTLDGFMVVSKGAKGPEELASAAKALQTLKGALENQQTLQLPEEAGERHLYVIKKVARTPVHYPRKAGIPHRKPLC
jgi:16S rRNA (guanine527-N7)-methyltransferase